MTTWILGDFGDYLNDCIDKAELSNAYVAKAIGCDRSYITHLIKGRKEPSVTTLIKLEEAVPGFYAYEAVEKMQEGYEQDKEEDEQDAAALKEAGKP